MMRMLSLVVGAWLALGTSNVAHAQAYVAVAPYAAPAPIVVVRPAPPARTHVWVEGRWNWNGYRYVWCPGYWAAPAYPGYGAYAGYGYRAVTVAPAPMVAPPTVPYRAVVVPARPVHPVVVVRR